MRLAKRTARTDAASRGEQTDRFLSYEAKGGRRPQTKLRPVGDVSGVLWSPRMHCRGSSRTVFERSKAVRSARCMGLQAENAPNPSLKLASSWASQEHGPLAERADGACQTDGEGCTVSCHKATALSFTLMLCTVVKTVEQDGPRSWRPRRRCAPTTRRQLGIGSQLLLLIEQPADDSLIYSKCLQAPRLAVEKSRPPTSMCSSALLQDMETDHKSDSTIGAIVGLYGQNFAKAGKAPPPPGSFETQGTTTTT